MIANKPVKMQTSPNSVEISVVIPAFNEEKHIGECLAGLTRSTLPLEGFEVILVDNGSLDKTIEVAQSFTRLKLRILSRPAVRIGGVRNEGAAAAVGEFLAFLDADCSPPPDWLTNAIILSRNRRVVLGGPYGVPPRYSWVAKVWAEHEARHYDGAKSFVHGANMIVRRDDFLSLSGFDKSLSTNEDYEFCQRAIAGGINVQARRELAVVHLGTPQSLSSFFKRQRWHGRHVIWVFLRSLPLLRNARAVFFGLYMLLGIIALIGSLAVTMRAGTLLPTFCSLLMILSAPLLLSARESFRRHDLRYATLLASLFLVYGIARALCFTDFFRDATKASRKHR